MRIFSPYAAYDILSICGFSAPGLYANANGTSCFAHGASHSTDDLVEAVESGAIFLSRTGTSLSRSLPSLVGAVSSDVPLGCFSVGFQLFRFTVLDFLFTLYGYQFTVVY